MPIGERLRHLREQKGFSQGDVDKVTDPGDGRRAKADKRSVARGSWAAANHCLFVTGVAGAMQGVSRDSEESLDC